MGRTNIPLAYVVRENVEPLNQALDPTENYTNHVDEMVARAPRGTRTYAEDNRRVFALIVDFPDEANMPYIEDARMDEDGRAAYFMLYDHHCSASVVSLVITNAEIALRDANYQGDDRLHNWETFLAKMKQQHSILDYLCRRGLYTGIDDHSKVRYLLTAIRDPRLDAAKASCYDKDKLKDMDTCVVSISSAWGRDSPTHRARSSTCRLLPRRATQHLGTPTIQVLP
jgi:hypothetical protein